MTEQQAPPLTIQEFLQARLDEDEERLKFTSNRGEWQPSRDYLTQRRGLIVHQPTEDELASFVYPADAEHAAYWQPRRVEAEIAAKRAVLHQHGAGDGAHECPDGFMDSAETEPHTGWEVECATIRILAAVYSDHEDWREEWRWSL